MKPLTPPEHLLELWRQRAADKHIPKQTAQQLGLSPKAKLFYFLRRN